MCVYAAEREKTTMRLGRGDLILRTYDPGDREALVALGDNINVAKWLANLFPHPYRLEDADEWIAAASRETPQENLAIVRDGELVGGVGVKPMRDVHAGTGEIGYWLGEPYWGRGIATRALGMMVEYAFDELLFVRLQALVFAGNAASMRVLEKNGFVREGVMRKHVRKNGVITDAVLYAKLRNP